MPQRHELLGDARGSVRNLHQLMKEHQYILQHTAYRGQGLSSFVHIKAKWTAFCTYRKIIIRKI